MDATISFRTDLPGIGTELGVFRDGPNHLRLYVIASDGTGRVDFVHRGGDRAQSIAVFRALAEHALRIADELAGQPDDDFDFAGEALTGVLA